MFVLVLVLVLVLGLVLGDREGETLGLLDGLFDGLRDGDVLGLVDGLALGPTDGYALGLVEGFLVGEDGADVGALLGLALGRAPDVEADAAQDACGPRLVMKAHGRLRFARALRNLGIDVFLRPRNLRDGSRRTRHFPRGWSTPLNNSGADRQKQIVKFTFSKDICI